VETFWEAVRSSKEYDVAYIKPEDVISDVEKIIIKEQEEWKDLCKISNNVSGEKDFSVDIPTVDQIKNRPFFKFLSVTGAANTKDQFVQNWYIERLRA
jgi:hypothetical protein